MEIVFFPFVYIISLRFLNVLLFCPQFICIWELVTSETCIALGILETTLKVSNLLWTVTLLPLLLLVVVVMKLSHIKIPLILSCCLLFLVYIRK